MSASATYAATLDDVHHAAVRIRPHAHVTPVLTCAAIDERAGRRVHFKCEPFQRIGAFKFRGACNAVMQLEGATSVIAHSSGNHAQALALAARLRGLPATIVMPENAPRVKVDAVRGYGAEVVFCRPTLEDREGTVARLLAERDATLVHPYDDPAIIAGQGTCALELLDQAPALDAVIAPIGGGGLMSGTCVAVRGKSPRTRLFAAEPAGADDAARSMAAGELIPQTAPKTIADGLLTSLGAHTWPIVRDHVERVITVDDDATIAAMRLVMERMKVVIEPSSAVAVAALLSDEFRALEGIDRVGVILSGGNAALDSLPFAHEKTR